MASQAINICFVALDAYPLFDSGARGVQGGAEVDVYMLSTELAKDPAFKVSLVTGDFGQKDIEIFENVTIYKTGNLRSPAASINIWRAMRRADADIYFKKGASLVTAFVAFFCKLNKRAFILRTSHISECDGSYYKAQLLRGLAYKWTLRTAKHVFVQSRQHGQYLLKTTGLNSIAIPNGHRISPPADSIRKWILWVGRNVAFKRPELFVQLAQECPDEQFVMVCQRTKGDNNFNKPTDQAKFFNQIQNTPNLKLIDYVPFHQIDTYFAQAKVFVNTSDTEGFPNTFIQACKCGTPILSLNINPDDFLDKYKCGICANGDWADFAKMFILLCEPQIWEKCSGNAVAYARENHDIAKIVEQYKNIFSQYNHKRCSKKG